jgi:hypothetical protein
VIKSEQKSTGGCMKDSLERKSITKSEVHFEGMAVEFGTGRIPFAVKRLNEVLSLIYIFTGNIDQNLAQKVLDELPHNLVFSREDVRYSVEARLLGVGIKKYEKTFRWQFEDTPCIRGVWDFFTIAQNKRDRVDATMLVVGKDQKREKTKNLWQLVENGRN